MKIGIDIDDVITSTSEKIEEYIMKDNNRQKLQEHMKEIMKGNPSEPEVMSFCMENYLRVFQEVKTKDNARVYKIKCVMSNFNREIDKLFPKKCLCFAILFSTKTNKIIFYFQCIKIFNLDILINFR